MTIEADIKTALDDHSGLSALIGSRSYAIRLPDQPTYPCVVFSRIETTPNHTLTGRNNLTMARWQFEVRSQTYGEARDVVEQLKSALEGATFTALLESEQDIPYEDEVKVYRVDVDFDIWFIDI